jgi:cytidylate kinase
MAARRYDSSRALAPLKPAPDAVILDTTDLTVDQVLERVVTLAEA